MPFVPPHCIRPWLHVVKLTSTVFIISILQQVKERDPEIGSKILLCYTVGFNRGFKVHSVFVSKPT